jgi:hypothetical protein
MHRSNAWCSVGLGVALAMISVAAADAAYIPVRDGEAAEADTPARDFAAETHLYCLALAVYFEGGSTAENLEGQQHIASVVFERAKANVTKWGGADICDVVFYKRAGVCQFSFACLPGARRTPRGGSRWEQSLAVARGELEGKSVVRERTPRYYMNPALTSDRNACRFRKEFVPVLEAGRHEFFREPTEEERTALATAEHEACKRHAAALEAAKKRMAQAIAKKKRLALAKQKKKAKKTQYAHR